LTPGAHEQREFGEGGHKARRLVDARCCDLYLVHMLHGNAGRGVDDSLCRLLLFSGAL